SLWLLLNGETVLGATDASFDSGGVRLQIARLGELDSDEQVAVSVRALRVSALATSDDDHTPTYQAPAEVAATWAGPGQVVPDEGRSHVSPNTPISYVNNPPTSGPHYPTWTRPGVYP